MRVYVVRPLAMRFASRVAFAMSISFSRTLRYARAWLTGRDDLLQDDVMLDRDGTIVPATLLRPRAPASPLPGWVVMHGITRAGRGHAQLVRFARAIASTGAVVIIPEVPEWRRLDLAPHLTAPTIRSAIDALRKTPDVHEGPFGLVGFSFGAPHTVAAAGDPRLRADIAGAVSFGGYCDLGRTIHFMMTGQHEHDGHEISLRPRPVRSLDRGRELPDGRRRLRGRGRRGRRPPETRRPRGRHRSSGVEPAVRPGQGPRWPRGSRPIVASYST